nr:hypothetical protein [Acinetobacter baumannii]
MQWGREKTHLFYPQGTQAGLDIQDKGHQTVLDAQGGRYEGNANLLPMGRRFICT